MEDSERHVAVVVALDPQGRLLVQLSTRSVPTAEFTDSWPHDVAADMVATLLGIDVSRGRMAATHVDLGDDLLAHFLWVKVHGDEMARLDPGVDATVVWLTADEVAADPSALADGPARSEALRLAFGWTDVPHAKSAMPAKVDPTAVDWDDPEVRAAALATLTDDEVDLVSGQLSAWEVTVGGGDGGRFLLTADGPGGTRTALASEPGEDDVDLRVGGQMVTVPGLYALSRSDVDKAVEALLTDDIDEWWESEDGPLP